MSRTEDDSGAVAIMVTVCLILLFVCASLALDLGFARADVRENQSMSDFASLAAIDSLRRGGTREAACHAAVDYAFANAKELAMGTPEHTAARAECAVFQALDTGSCDNGPTNPTAPVTATALAPPYTISVTSPVPDNDPAMTVGGQGPNEEVDGKRCDRVKVAVVRERDYIFAPVAGNLSGQPAADAVAVSFEVEEPNDIASLIVLEQTDCDALTTGGTGASYGVRNRVLADGTVYPGNIAVDSDGTSSPRGIGTDCTSGTRWASNPGTGTICAAGSVGSYAMGAGDPTMSHPPGSGTASCLPSPDGLGAIGLGVQVTPRERRLGRKAVDWLANCQASYPSYNTAGNQRYPFYADTPACPPPLDPTQSSPPPFLDNLHGQLQTGSLSGFHVIGNCSGNVTNPTGQRKIHVTCTPGGSTNSINFTNVTHVVFDNPIPQNAGNVTVTGGDVDPADGFVEGAVVYFRNGGIRRTMTGSSVTFTNAFVYINSATADSIDTNGGNVTWSSVRRDFVDGKPVATRGCNRLATLPAAACFAPLALWSNSTAIHTFGGNGSQVISGSYFMPNAHVRFNGGGIANFTNAQFFGRTMQARGGGQVIIVPNPETNIPPTSVHYGLIR